MISILNKPKFPSSNSRSLEIKLNNMPPGTLLREMIENGHARPMGSIENIYGIFNRQKLYRNFSMFAEINDFCNERQLRAALRNMCLKNPILLHTIVPEIWPFNEKYYLSDEYYCMPRSQHEFIAILPELDLSDILANKQTQYQQVLEKAFREFESSNFCYTSEVYKLIATISIPYVGPSWRLICLPEKRGTEWRKFIFISNHCLCDGRSAANFFHDLKEELNCNIDNRLTVTTIFSYERDHYLLPKLPEPLEKRIDFRPPWSYFPKYLVWEPIVNHFKFSSNCATSRLDESFDGKTLLTEIINIDVQVLEKVRQLIKANVHEGGTITPFLEICWLISLHKWGAFSGKSWTKCLTDVFVPVDVRNLLPDDDDIRKSYRYGCNVAAIELNPWISQLDVEKNSDEFWALVSQNQYKITSLLQKKEQLNLIGFNTLDIVEKNFNLDRELCVHTLNKPRQGTLLSNLGIFPQNSQERDKYSLENLIFGQFQGSFRESFSMCVCSTDRKGMNIVLTTTSDLIPNSKSWEDLCSTFKSIISEN